MKFLRALFDKTEPLFDKPMLRPLKCIYDATDAFFFAPGHVTETDVHVRDALDVKRYMSIVIVAALPALLASIYFFGLRVIGLIIVSYAVGGAVETLFCIIRKEDITEGFLVTGLLFPLTLPPTTPYWVCALGVAFGVAFGKEIFGGTGRNPFNPALVGRCFVFLAYPKQMAEGWVTPGSGLFGRVFQYVGPGHDAVTAATPLISAAKGQMTDSFGSLLMGSVSGSAGETSAILILLGGVLLCATKVGNWRIPVSILASAFVTALIFQPLAPDSIVAAHRQLVMGGLMFGAAFMATDPVTAPSTDPARIMYGILIGVLTVLLRGLTPLNEGIMFAILLMNIFAPLLDEAVVALRCRTYAVSK